MSNTITLHTSPRSSSLPSKIYSSVSNPLPPLLQTPSGLALLELQGAINLPPSPSSSLSSSPVKVPIGRLEFPEYDPSKPSDSTAWMKRVYLWVGQHQRLQGQVQKLAKPLGVVRKRTSFTASAGTGFDDEDREREEGEGAEELEIVQVVKYKIVFAHRPEPVTASSVGTATGAEVMEMD
ncbi:chromosome transmission fidelity protein [Podospora australis]|uniref:Chromosome transmission fidelity protein n=1 Tax=Podospora australis TaxID=1536484 RepID=A0AAN6WXT4_9PEZI|nr:chromosome transmission fidelity protein [Podospora australis]